MNGVLVRIGVDAAYGRWNAPADPITREFVYVPIPESATTEFHASCERRYHEIGDALARFADSRGLNLASDLRFPEALTRASMHLDPDFETLTYGDVGARRGSDIRFLERGDLLVFYAGLRPVSKCEHRLIYAIIGVFTVDHVVNADEVPCERWNENAHTRKIKRGDSDIVVRAIRSKSGRLRHLIPIGEFRNRAYRVRHDLLEEWGGISVNDGYIQRSARPPRFLDAARFYDWFTRQNPALVQSNW
jgi:hypothetical protein